MIAPCDRPGQAGESALSGQTGSTINQRTLDLSVSRRSACTGDRGSKCIGADRLVVAARCVGRNRRRDGSLALGFLAALLLFQVAPPPPRS